MPDYQTMYFNLFNTITDAIELLKKAQQLGEQLFMMDEAEPEDQEID